MWVPLNYSIFTLHSHLAFQNGRFDHSKQNGHAFQTNHHPLYFLSTSNLFFHTFTTFNATNLVQYHLHAFSLHNIYIIQFIYYNVMPPKFYQCSFISNANQLLNLIKQCILTLLTFSYIKLINTFEWINKVNLIRYSHLIHLLCQLMDHTNLYILKPK